MPRASLWEKQITTKGKKFKKYSTNTLVIPSGAFFADGWKTSNKRLLKSKEASFTKRNSKYWVVIKGGYAKLKSNRFPQDGGKVNLHVTGGMLDSLAIVKHGNNSITIGFNSSEQAKKAMYHEVTVAGKSKVKRQFMNLPQKEVNKITHRLQARFKAELQEYIVKNIVNIHKKLYSL